MHVCVCARVLAQVCTCSFVLLCPDDQLQCNAMLQVFVGAFRGRGPFGRPATKSQTSAADARALAADTAIQEAEDDPEISDDDTASDPELPQGRLAPGALTVCVHGTHTCTGTCQRLIFWFRCRLTPQCLQQRFRRSNAVVGGVHLPLPCH